MAERLPRYLLWQIALLVPHPVLTVLYLFAVRADRVAPSFVPVVSLAVLPLSAAVLGVRRLFPARPTGARGAQMVLLAVALLEISFTVLAAAVVGFAIGLRSL